jgi:hypothetical protein
MLFSQLYGSMTHLIEEARQINCIQEEKCQWLVRRMKLGLKRQVHHTIFYSLCEASETILT